MGRRVQYAGMYMYLRLYPSIITTTCVVGAWLPPMTRNTSCAPGVPPRISGVINNCFIGSLLGEFFYDQFCWFACILRSGRSTGSTTKHSPNTAPPGRRQSFPTVVASIDIKARKLPRRPPAPTALSSPPRRKPVDAFSTAGAENSALNRTSASNTRVSPPGELLPGKLARKTDVSACRRRCGRASQPTGRRRSTLKAGVTGAARGGEEQLLSGRRGAGERRRERSDERDLGPDLSPTKGIVRGRGGSA